MTSNHFKPVHVKPVACAEIGPEAGRRDAAVVSTRSSRRRSPRRTSLSSMLLRSAGYPSVACRTGVPSFLLRSASLVRMSRLLRLLLLLPTVPIALLGVSRDSYSQSQEQRYRADQCGWFHK